MKKWLGTGLIVLTLAALAITARWWMTPLLNFLGANSDVIQSLADAAQLLLWLDAGAVFLVGWWPKSKADDATRSAGSEPLEIVEPQQNVPDLERAVTAYRDHLTDRYRYLDFRGMGVTHKAPLRFSLIDMYVPLKARIELPEGETWARSLPLAGRMMSAEEVAAVGERLSEPLPVLDLLRERDGLIILGDPGAGKTTFLKYLTLMLAQGRADELDMEERLPVLIPLSAYANALADGDAPLDRFVVTYYEDRGIDVHLDAMLEDALDQGKALLLLDGLDEVREQHLRRTVVDRVVDFFSMQRRRGNKFILTSRIVGYRAVRPVVEGLDECTLADFDQDEIELFIHKWTQAMEQAALGETNVAASEAEREEKELLDAVRRNPGVRRLAANPLLLTILALMKRQGVTLPERRVELYQRYVETLLTHWNQARSLDRPLQYEMDGVATLRILAPLALWMHEISPGVGLVKQAAMEAKLEEIYRARGAPDADVAARRFLADVHEYAGLLLERGHREYGFIHLTFQEYLAAVAIAQQGQESVEPVVKTLAAHVGEQPWREVSLLTVGYMGIVQARDQAASTVVSRLVTQAPGEPGEAVVLAGDAVVDAGESGVTPACRQGVIQALLATMRDDVQVEAVRRAAAGRALSKLGDPRPEVLDPLKIEWIEIPAGPFIMGRDDGMEREKSQHTLDLGYAFRISRFPITNAQFQVFVDDGGYREARYWTEAQATGWWRDGKAVRGRYRWKDESQQEIELFATEEAIPPAEFGEPFNLSNHPVMGITWYEALAFARWLSEQMEAEGLLKPGEEASLPSEAEWERADRGAAGRVYPWGDNPDPNRANWEEIGLKATSPVGAFPGGVTPDGIEDLSGNVWEWTRSLWGTDLRTPEFGYPYDPEDGREALDPDEKTLRVVRGASWYDAKLGRCAVRRWGYPDVGSRSYGIRLVQRPPCPTDR